MEQPLPFILSPYLRPLLRQGHLCLDNGITTQLVPLSPLAERVVRALWPTEADGDGAASARLQALAAEEGDDPVCAALEELWHAAVLFPDRESCESVFNRVLDRQVQHVPFLDQIELTSHCPMRCGFCPRGVPGRMQRPSGFLDLGLFQRLLTQLHPRQQHYRPLELHHLGESLLHPQVADFVAAASARGLPTEMSVNPSLLSPDLGKRLCTAGIRRLVISLDGMDQETLVQIRGPVARYDRAEGNLDALLSHVAGMADPPAVVIQMIDLHRNRHQRQAFLSRWGNLGLPSVRAYIKDLDGDDPDLDRPSATPNVHLCTYPFRSVVVLWDGRVVPCCRDDDAHLVLGDLNRSTLAEIWQGEAVKKLRQQHQSGVFPDGHLCDGCAWRRERFAEALKGRHPDRATDNPLHW